MVSTLTTRVLDDGGAKDGQYDFVSFLTDPDQVKLNDGSEVLSTSAVNVPSPWWAPQPGTASLLNFAFLTELLHLRFFSHLKTALFDRAGVGSASE